MKRYPSFRKSSIHPLMGVEPMVIFDLETTGLRASEDEITQIAAIRIGGWNMEIVDTFDTFVNPGKPIPNRVRKLTGITDEDVKDAPSPLEALQAFCRFANGAVLFGHDIYRFDFKFIKKHVTPKQQEADEFRFIDTMDIFTLMWSDFSRLHHGLDEIAERLGTGLNTLKRHRADGDAALLTRIFHRIQTDPRLEGIASNVPIHTGRLPAFSTNPGLN